jgi:uncharacterized protein YukE
MAELSTSTSMSADQLKVSTEGLKSVAQDMNSKKEEIMNIYNGTLKQIIESSKECISTSGLDFDAVNSVFARTFKNLDTSISQLSDVLLNKIIPSYEDLSSDIRYAFNNEFADEMSKLLGI